MKTKPFELLRNVMQELNDSLGEKFDDKSLINFDYRTNSYSGLLSVIDIKLLDTENNDLYDDEEDEKPLKSGREKVLIELREQFLQIQKDVKCINQYLNSQLKDYDFMVKKFGDSHD